MYRNLKFLHMIDFFSTDTVLVSVTNIRYDNVNVLGVWVTSARWRGWGLGRRTLLHRVGAL